MTNQDIDDLHRLALKAQAEANAVNRDPRATPDEIRAANRKARIAWAMHKKALDRLEKGDSDDAADDREPAE